MIKSRKEEVKSSPFKDNMILYLENPKDTQDGQVMVESSDKMWSTEEENGKPLQYSYLENTMKRQTD